MYLHKILYILNVLNKAEMLSTWTEENDLVDELKQTKKTLKRSLNSFLVSAAQPGHLWTNGKDTRVEMCMLMCDLSLSMTRKTVPHWPKSCSGTFSKAFLFVLTHQQDHFPPFMCWASQLYWVHSEYTIFYEDILSITMCATKQLVSTFKPTNNWISW